MTTIVIVCLIIFLIAVSLIPNADQRHQAKMMERILDRADVRTTAETLLSGDDYSHLTEEEKQHLIYKVLDIMHP